MTDSQSRSFVHVSIVGGSKNDLSLQYLGCPNTHVLVVDNPREIELKREFYERHGISYFPIGADSSSHSLVERTDLEILDQTRQTANFSADNGLGARPLFGAEAAKKLIDSVEFKAYLASLLDKAIIATGGRPESIKHEMLGSDCGATAGGAGPVIEKSIVDTLSKFGKVIDSTIDFVGPTTFAGASTRSRQISSATKAVLLITSRRSTEADKRTPRTFYFSELPPLGRNQNRRNQLLHL